jgi:hypothetical protein
MKYQVEDISYDLWLIDTLTEKMLLIEREVDEADAIDWFREWNKRHRECVCVMAPVAINMPAVVRIKTD